MNEVLSCYSCDQFEKKRGRGGKMRGKELWNVGTNIKKPSHEGWMLRVVG
jgi:hypothetical protein